MTKKVDTSGWLEQVVQDVRYSIRALRMNPGFALSAILALALGIGANTALFSAIYGSLLRPLPYAAGDRLVELHQLSPQARDGEIFFSVNEVSDYRAGSHTFEQLEEYHDFPYVIRAPYPDKVRAGVVSHGFFGLLGIAPELGRDFESADDAIGAPPVMILTHEYWRRVFASDPHIIGKTVKMNERLYTVVGVLPLFAQYPRENQIYIPTASSPLRSSDAMREARTRRLLRLFGRLKPGVTLSAANAEMSSILAALHREHPADYKNEANVTTVVKTVHEELGDSVRPTLMLLLGTAGLVLLICCSNVANLLLARMVRREQEFSVRTALGASRRRLLQQVLTESIVLAVISALFAIALAKASLSLIVRYLEHFTPRAQGITLNLQVLLFALATSIAAGLLFGIAPAFTAGRTKGGLNVRTASGSGSHGSHILRATLIAGQVALCFVLLSAAGLMLRTLLKLEQVRAGFDADQVVTMELPYNYAKYGEAADSDGRKLYAYEQEIVARVRTIPGINSAGMLSMVPLRQNSPYQSTFNIEGDAVDPAHAPEANSVHMSPGAFQALGVSLVRGRLLNDTDDKQHPAVVVTESMVRRYFGNEDPIGRRVRGDGTQMGLPGEWMPIVGVVRDVHMFGLNKDAPDTIYLPLATEPRNGFLFVIRSSSDLPAAAAAARKMIQTIDPEQPVTGIKTLQELRGESLLTVRATTTLLAVFAGLALVIAATGLAGVTAFLVGQRTREIGIRVALGATPGQVLALVLGYGAKLSAIGAAIGLMASLSTDKLLQKFLFGVKPVDWFSLAMVAVALCGTSLFASYVPARRAAKVDAVVALRTD